MSSQKKRNLPVLAVLCLPIVLYFSYIACYGVNFIFWDEWDSVPMVHHFLAGNLTFSDVWSRHNENRMLLPNLFFLLNAEFNHFNTKFEMFVSGIFLLISFLMIVKVYRSRTHRALSWMIPVSFLMFSFSQYENILWGFQVAWYFILVCLIGVFYLLESPHESGRQAGRFWFSVFLATSASFSSFQGLLLWPAGLLYLLANRFDRTQRIIWIVSGACVTGLYFTHLGFHKMGVSLAPIYHPIESFKFLLIAIGSVIPVSSGYFQLPPFGFHPAEFTGALLLLLGGGVIVQGIRKGPDDKSYLLPAGLCLFAILFDLSLVGGRQQFGLLQATAPHYTTYNLLLIVGIYLGLLRELQNLRVNPIRFIVVMLRFSPNSSIQLDNVNALRTITGVVFCIAFVQVLVSYYVGLKEGKDFYRSRVKGAQLLVNHDLAPDLLITNYATGNAALFRKEAPFLESHDLSVFATSNVIVYRKKGLPVKLLPAPYQIEFLLKKDPALARAWTTLSMIYDVRGDLQKAFPLDSPKSVNDLISWTLNTTDNLRPLVDKYRNNLIFIRGKLVSS